MYENKQVFILECTPKVYQLQMSMNSLNDNKVIIETPNVSFVQRMLISITCRWDQKSVIHSWTKYFKLL